MRRVGRRGLLSFLLVGAVVGAVAELPAQTLSGVLLDRGTERPVAQGLLTLLTLEGDTVASALSAEDGTFRMTAPEGGEFRLAVSALGYLSSVSRSVLALPEGSSMSLEFRVEAIPVELEGVEAEVQRPLLSQPALVQNGFVRRAQRGFGRFITPGDIEKSNEAFTTGLLQRTGRVTTRYALGGDRVLMRSTMGGYCAPSIFVDGQRMDSGTPIDRIVPLDLLEAAEVYRSEAEAPIEYRTSLRGCGVILLWTKVR